MGDRVSSKERPGTNPHPGIPEYLTGGALLAFVILISLFAIRSNDIWWHMAVGKELLMTQRFITHDPYLFSLTAAPWVPHAWLSAILFYAVHAGSGLWGLVIFRAVIVTAVMVLLFRALNRLGISLVLASPVIMLVVLNAHSRFILRPHLFEYLFIVLLLGWLIIPRPLRGARFYVFPLVLQLLWVNAHASFYIGPLLVLLFFTGEKLSALVSWSQGLLGAGRVAWKPVVLLLVAMAGVTFINPSPIEFVVQPLQAEQRELVAQYTMEWRSPFDPLMKAAPFHPYYEILLALALAAFVVAGKRVRLSSLLLVGFFALLSLKAHRFRVEFALVALPLVLEQLSVAPITQRIRRRLAGPRTRGLPAVAALALAALLIVGGRDRVVIDGAVSDRFPREAFDFIREAGVAHRPFHTIAFGSYLIWDLYPERKGFIDGRNFDAGLYDDFLQCQTISAGFNGAIRKYDLDAFILPSPERSDGGIRRVHSFLIQSSGWSLVHIDRVAFVYVKDNTVDGGWLVDRAYRLYHPMTFAGLESLPDDLEGIAGELARAHAEAADYVRVLLDSGRFYGAIGERAVAAELLDRALALDPDNAEAHAIRKLIIR